MLVFFAEILFKYDIDKTIFSFGSRLNNYIFFLLCQSRKKLKHFHIVNGGKKIVEKKLSFYRQNDLKESDRCVSVSLSV